MIRQRGLSLIELMIGLTIGILILTVLSSLVVNTSRARSELDQSMQQIENGRYAMQMLASELRLAGYYGQGMSGGSPPMAVPDPCLTDTASLKAALPLPVQGYSQPATSPLSCLSNANLVPGQDILVIRRAHTAPTAIAALDAAKTYIQTIGTKTLVADGSSAAAYALNDLTGNPAEIYPYSLQIYYVSPCDVPASGTSCTGAGDDKGNPIPTLKRLELVNGVLTPVTLVQGVDRMIVEYGIDADNDAGPDGAFVTAPTTVAGWTNVVAVKINLLARNTKPTPGYKDTKSYTLGTVTVAAANDAFKRHAYSGVTRLMNVSDRRQR